MVTARSERSAMYTKQVLTNVICWVKATPTHATFSQRRDTPQASPHFWSWPGAGKLA